MKSNYFYFSLIILSFLIFATIACNDDLENSMKKNQIFNLISDLPSGVTIANNILFFDDWESFEELREIMEENNIDEDPTLNDIDGFTSFNNYLSISDIEELEGEIPDSLVNVLIDIEQPDEEIYREPQIESGFYQHIANPVGIFVVDDSVYNLTYHEYYRFHSAQLAAFNNYGLDSVTGITTFAIGNDVEQCDNQYTHNSKTYRVTGEWDRDQIFGTILTARTKHRVRTWFGIWKYKDVNSGDSIRTMGSITVGCDTGFGISSRVVTINDWAFGEAEVHFRVNFPPNALCDDNYRTPSSTRHRAKCLDGVTRQCILSR